VYYPAKGPEALTLYPFASAMQVQYVTAFAKTLGVLQENFLFSYKYLGIAYCDYE
jgi:hypothetical protein